MSSSTKKSETRAAKRQRLLDELAALDASEPKVDEEMLKRLVDILIPADLKRNGAFQLKTCTITPNNTAEGIYSDIHSGLQNMKYNILAEVVFDFRDYMRNASETRFRCYLQLVNADRIEFHCETQLLVKPAPGELYGKDAPWSVRVTSDIDVFEAAFHKAAREANSTYHPAFGTTPAWCYILLSMLVYTDHVFDPADNADFSRVQHVFKESDAMAALLEPFWDLTNEKHAWAQGLYPFIVQLMPPAFALSIRGDAPELFFKRAGCIISTE